MGGAIIATAGPPVGPPSRPAISGRRLSRHLVPEYSNHTLQAIVGPHIRRLGAAGRKELFGSPFKVSKDADRMGYRLEGPGLDASGEELLSFGLAAGAIQGPRSGHPIPPLADPPTPDDSPLAPPL